MSEFADITGPGSLRLVRTLAAPVEVVWKYLTDPGLRAVWFAGGAVEPRVGGALTLVFRNSELSDAPLPDRFAPYEGMVQQTTVTRWDPPRVFGFLFGGGDAEVVFELEPAGEGTQLVLTQTGMSTRAGLVDVAGGWHSHVGLLGDILAGGPRREFWGEVAAAETEYERRIPKAAP